MTHRTIQAQITIQAMSKMMVTPRAIHCVAFMAAEFSYQ